MTAPAFAACKGGPHLAVKFIILFAALEKTWILADSLRAGIAAGFLKRRIDIKDRSVGVSDHNYLGGLFNGRAQPGQRFFNQPAPGDVSEAPEASIFLPVPAQDQGGLPFQHRAIFQFNLIPGMNISIRREAAVFFIKFLRIPGLLTRKLILQLVVRVAGNFRRDLP